MEISAKIVYKWIVLRDLTSPSHLDCLFAIFLKIESVVRRSGSTCYFHCAVANKNQSASNLDLYTKFS